MVYAVYQVLIQLYLQHLQHYFRRHCLSYLSYQKTFPYQINPSSIILFISFNRINSIIIDNTSFVRANLKSYPIYLISNNSINSLLSYNNLSLISLNFIIFIDLIYILYIIILYIRTQTKVLFLILPNQLLVNYLSILVSSILVVLILKSLFFS